ncbi:MAG: amidophosphoribosyltransferase [Bdellovibrio sp.]
MTGFREECAVMGVWNHEEAARLAYLGLYAMQHRGQESAGIVSMRSGEHILHKGLGLVGDVFKEHDLNRLVGDAAIGHVRYSTTGQNSMANAQPLAANLLNGPVALAHNGNIVNADGIRRQLKETGAIFTGSSDTECFLHLISRTDTNEIVEALKRSLAEVVGAYSLVVMTHDRLVAVRDPHGFRPLVLGTKANDKGQTSYIVASETCALDLIGAKYIREIEPGEIFWIDDNGTHSEIFAKAARLSRCVFEHVYFARPDSIVFGRSVYESRKQFGRWLAKENPVEADVVIPVPDSGVPSALGYSTESGIPFEFGIIRNHYVGRTFIQPAQSIRAFGVKIKLNPQSAVLAGKRVIVVDDSLVRGTTSQKIIRLIRQAGAKQVHMRIASPPTIGPCYYGVDTPQKSHLIAANQSLAEIRQFIEADSLSYLSLQGMFQGLQSQSSQFCAACFDSKYPTPLENDSLPNSKMALP